MIVAVAVVLLGASIYWSQTATESANEGIVETENVKGNPDAAVVLVEYSDFQCPACAQLYPVAKQIVEEYGDSLRFEYKHFPLISIHPYAVPAARAAEAAGQQGKFFEMHDKLFENQSTWSSSVNPQTYFVAYAEEIGLDVDQFKLQMKASLLDEKIQASFEEARSKGYTGTPTFELNGERMTFETIEDLLLQIDVAVNGPGETVEGGEVVAPASAETNVRFGF